MEKMGPVKEDVKIQGDYRPGINNGPVNLQRERMW
jgi:hypothetical protein